LKKTIILIELLNRRLLCILKDIDLQLSGVSRSVKIARPQ